MVQAIDGRASVNEGIGRGVSAGTGGRSTSVDEGIGFRPASTVQTVGRRKA